MATTTQAAPTIRERVQAGAAWLTEHRPGWLDRIDLITLDLSDPECCVLGQLDGGYSAVAAPDPRALGFDTYWSTNQPGPYNARWWRANDAEYAALTEAWKTYVLERAVACCPCTGVICDPGCPCPSCPKSEAELTDD